MKINRNQPLKKEYVYEYYTRIVDNFKDYEHEIMSQWEEPYRGERKENNEITDKEIH